MAKKPKAKLVSMQHPVSKVVHISYTKPVGSICGATHRTDTFSGKKKPADYTVHKKLFLKKVTCKQCLKRYSSLNSK